MNESIASSHKTYGDLSNTMMNDQLLADMKAKYGRDIDEYLATRKDTADSEEIRTDIADMAKASNDHEKLSQYLAIKLENEFQNETRDNRVQLARLRNSLNDIQNNIEVEKDIPFEILSGKIYTMRVKVKGLDFFDKDNYDLSTQYQEMGDDETRYNDKTGRYEIDIMYNGFTHTLDFEYEGGNVIKIHDRYNQVTRVNVSVKNIQVQDIEKLTNTRYKIESYSEAKEISLPFKDKMIKLVILFKDTKTD